MEKNEYRSAAASRAVQPRVETTDDEEQTGQEECRDGEAALDIALGDDPGDAEGGADEGADETEEEDARGGDVVDELEAPACAEAALGVGLCCACVRVSGFFFAAAAHG